MHRRWRGAWPRRGRRFEPPWPQGPQTVWRPPAKNQAGWRPRWPQLRLRRGRSFEPPWPQAEQGQPWPSQTRQPGSHPRWARVWRGQLIEPPWPPPPPPVPPACIGPAGARPRFGPRLRRGRFFQPLLAQANDGVFPFLLLECAFNADPADVAAVPAWTDLTPRLKRFTVKVGRQYERDENEAGELHAQLKNSDGALTPTNTASPFWPGVLPDRDVRLRAAWDGIGYSLLRAGAERWPPRWEADGAAGWTDLVAVDALEALAGVTLGSAYDREVLDDDPIGYYPLGEPAGATSFGSIAAAGQPLATIVNSKYGAATVAAGAGGIVASGTATSVAFSDADGVNKKGSVIQLAAGGYGPYVVNQAGTGWSAELWFVASAPVTDPGLLWTQVASNTGVGLFANGQIKLNTNGTLTVSLVDAGGTTPASPRYDDNAPHHVVFGFAADGRTWTLYVDGAQVLSGVNATVFGFNIPRPGWSLVGGLLTSGAQQQFLGTGATVRVQMVAVYLSMLSSARVAAHHTAGTTGFAGETSGARVQRILRYANWTGEQAIDTGSSTMGSAADLAGKTALEALQTVARDENGNLYVDGQSQVAFKGRSARYNAPVTWVFGSQAGELPYVADAQPDFDKTFIKNIVSASRPGGVKVTRTDETSRKRHRDRTLNEDVNVATDLEVQDRADYLLARHKDPHLRLPELRLLPHGNPALWPAALGARLGDRVRWRFRPPAQTGAPMLEADFFIESITHEVEVHRTWETTLGLSPADVETWWVLGDTTLSALDTTTIPAY